MATSAPPVSSADPHQPTPPAGALSQLCQSCAICCDGSLFRDVHLQAADDPAHLRSLALPLVRRRGRVRFDQPCVALQECACRIYTDRPRHCRQFECALFKAVCAGRIDLATAQGVIRTARQRGERVRGLLRQLKDTDEHLALNARCRQTSRRLESGGSDDPTAEWFAQLTLAAHDLNLLLHEAFYPGAQTGVPRPADRRKKVRKS